MCVALFFWGGFVGGKVQVESGWEGEGGGKEITNVSASIAIIDFYIYKYLINTRWLSFCRYIESAIKRSKQSDHF